VQDHAQHRGPGDRRDARPQESRLDGRAGRSDPELRGVARLGALHPHPDGVAQVGQLHAVFGTGRTGDGDAVTEPLVGDRHRDRLPGHPSVEQLAHAKRAGQGRQRRRGEDPGLDRIGQCRRAGRGGETRLGPAHHDADALVQVAGPHEVGGPGRTGDLGGGAVPAVRQMYRVRPPFAGVGVQPSPDLGRPGDARRGRGEHPGDHRGGLGGVFPDRLVAGLGAAHPHVDGLAQVGGHHVVVGVVGAGDHRAGAVPAVGEVDCPRTPVPGVRGQGPAHLGCAGERGCRGAGEGRGLDLGGGAGVAGHAGVPLFRAGHPDLDPVSDVSQDQHVRRVGGARDGRPRAEPAVRQRDVARTPGARVRDERLSVDGGSGDRGGRGRVEFPRFVGSRFLRCGFRFGGGSLRCRFLRGDGFGGSGRLLPGGLPGQGFRGARRPARRGCRGDRDRGFRPCRGGRLATSAESGGGDQETGDEGSESRLPMLVHGPSPRQGGRASGTSRRYYQTIEVLSNRPGWEG